MKKSEQGWYDQEFPATNTPEADVSRDVHERQGAQTLDDIATITGQERKDAFLPNQQRPISHGSPDPEHPRHPEIDPGREPQRESEHNMPPSAPEVIPHRGAPEIRPNPERPECFPGHPQEVPSPL